MYLRFVNFAKTLLMNFELFLRSWQRTQLHSDQGRIQKGCLAQEELFEIAQKALRNVLWNQIKPFYTHLKMNPDFRSPDLFILDLW